MPMQYKMQQPLMLMLLIFYCCNSSQRCAFPVLYRHVAESQRYPLFDHIIGLVRQAEGVSRCNVKCTFIKEYSCSKQDTALHALNQSMPSRLCDCQECVKVSDATLALSKRDACHTCSIYSLGIVWLPRVYRSE